MFKVRSHQKELLDDSIIQEDLLFQNLKELGFINKYLGGHRVSLSGLEKLTTDKSKTYHIIDIGCGGGDSLKTILKWSNDRGNKITLTGIDIKQDCVDFARENCKEFPEINIICADFRNVFTLKREVDIVHASLFFHHFSEDEIIAFIKLCHKNKAILLINDLERNVFAYYSIKFLTYLFSKSPLVKNDAPLSVQRGFKKTEWHTILQKANISNYLIKNCWAFRHSLIIYFNER
jgi:SAM-dependent methyltransferase